MKKIILIIVGILIIGTAAYFLLKQKPETQTPGQVSIPGNEQGPASSSPPAIQEPPSQPPSTNPPPTQEPPSSPPPATPPPTQEPPISPPPPSIPPSVPEAKTVAIRNFTFVPANLTIKAGTTVKWTNEDSAPHTVDSSIFNSPTLNQGNAFEFKFNTMGNYDYFCGIHPSMKGKIIVE